MFFNKYPYTDFHELNADWIITQFQSLLDRMAEVEETVASFEDRVSTLEGKMTTAEGNITNLQGRMTTAEGNITNLQGRMNTAEGTISSHTSAIAGIKASNLMNSTQLVPQSVDQPYTRTGTELKLRFKQHTYADGAKTSEDWYVIDFPMASPQGAGLMYAANAEAVEMLTKNGSDVLSSGGLQVTSVDTSNQHAVPDLQTVNTVTSVTIFDGDMYEPVDTDPPAPIIYSDFKQNQNGTFLYLQNNGQKAFWFNASNPQLESALINTGVIIRVRIPEAYRPARRMCWDFATIDINDTDHGPMRATYDSGVLSIIFYGQTGFSADDVICIEGLYMPFM